MQVISLTPQILFSPVHSNCNPLEIITMYYPGKDFCLIFRTHQQISQKSPCSRSPPPMHTSTSGFAKASLWPSDFQPATQSPLNQEGGKQAKEFAQVFATSDTTTQSSSNLKPAFNLLSLWIWSSCSFSVTSSIGTAKFRKANPD